MKIRMEITEIEASADEVRASQTIGDAFRMALTRAFAPMGYYDTEEDEEEQE